jgi:hypothetical protein
MGAVAAYNACLFPSETLGRLSFDIDSLVPSTKRSVHPPTSRTLHRPNLHPRRAHSRHPIPPPQQPPVYSHLAPLVPEVLHRVHPPSICPSPCVKPADKQSVLPFRLHDQHPAKLASFNHPSCILHACSKPFNMPSICLILFISIPIRSIVAGELKSSGSSMNDTSPILPSGCDIFACSLPSLTCARKVNRCLDDE